MGVLSVQEKREMKELALSKTIRDEFRLLRKQPFHDGPINIDRFIRFLTVMSRLNPKRRPRAIVEYKEMKL